MKPGPSDECWNFIDGLAIWRGCVGLSGWFAEALRSMSSTGYAASLVVLGAAPSLLLWLSWRRGYRLSSEVEHWGVCMGAYVRMMRQ
ncbi:unnamed protein product [Gongylonema pulchrum]|uniref:Inner membrane protein n=1 Tax=Gongylonema pulchrum TaxID=637853 RepID=A0A183DRZ9_9BILA|nr:unnamed protein product [Gongylonema pulchrum]